MCPLARPWRRCVGSSSGRVRRPIAAFPTMPQSSLACLNGPSKFAGLEPSAWSDGSSDRNHPSPRSVPCQTSRQCRSRAAHVCAGPVLVSPTRLRLGARLIDERERACDEDVIRSGAIRDYAESILKTSDLHRIPDPVRRRCHRSDLAHRVDHERADRLRIASEKATSCYCCHRACLRCQLPTARNRRQLFKHRWTPEPAIKRDVRSRQLKTIQRWQGRGVSQAVVYSNEPHGPSSGRRMKFRPYKS